MRNFLMGCLVLTSLFTLALRVEASLTCPDQSLRETVQDCPWAGIARTLTQKAATQKNLNEKDFQAAAPEITAQLKADSKKAELKALWGESINYDELAKGTILDPAILKVMAAIFKTPYVNDRTAHAGMEHTYGYLFSTLQTAYGYKRARWVQGELEAGFGFPRGELGPDAPKFKGTLLENVTYFAGNIAFRTEPATILKTVHRLRFNVSKEIREFDFNKLKGTRLQEEIQNPSVVLRTDLVPFTHPDAANPTGNQYILVYSVVVNGTAKLITAFPVGQSMFDSVVNPTGLGDGKPIITRYNAFIDGVSGKTFNGTRKVITGAAW